MYKGVNEIKLEHNIHQTQEQLAQYRRFKLRLRNVLHSTKYCAVCLDTENIKNTLDNIVITNWEGNYATSMKFILETVFAGQKLMLLTMDVCESCRENAINAFNFIQNSKQSVKILEHYIEQLNLRVDDIHSKMLSARSDNDIVHTVIVLEDPIAISKCEEEDTFEAFKEENIEIKQKKKRNGHFVCDYCEKVFVSKQGMSYHISKIHKKYFARKHLQKRNVKKYIRRFECPDCEKSDCEHSRYMQHYEKQRQAGQKLIQCIDCDYICSLKPTLIAHVNKVHLKTFKFVCEICSKPLHSKLAYKTHKKNFHTKYHNCQYCERPFQFLKNLESHQRGCKEYLRQFICHTCPASFDSRVKLNRHTRRHFEKFPCNLCNKVLMSAKNLKTHKEMHKSNKRMKMQYNYRCAICNESFTSATERDAHANKHNFNEKPACLSCNIKFKTPQDYTKHIQTSSHHAQNKGPRTSYSCSYCDYSTLAEFNLEAHINRYHLKVAPYKCDTCEKKFTNKIKLTSHMKTHLGLKTHHCAVCDNSFCGSAALRKHMRLHTGERPYLCEICGEGFISATVKNMHILKRHSEKTVACPLCHSMFFTLPLMRSHFKRVHWKVKGVKFDVTKVAGLKEEHYDLFRDRRLLTLDSK